MSLIHQHRVNFGLNKKYWGYLQKECRKRWELFATDPGAYVFPLSRHKVWRSIGKIMFKSSAKMYLLFVTHSSLPVIFNANKFMPYFLSLLMKQHNFSEWPVRLELFKVTYRQIRKSKNDEDRIYTINEWLIIKKQKNKKTCRSPKATLSHCCKKTKQWKHHFNVCTKHLFEIDIKTALMYLHHSYLKSTTSKQ